MCSSKKCDSKDLIFYPKYTVESLFKDNLKVTWFESDFSQSHYIYGNSSNGSNACTVIAILVAVHARCEKLQIDFGEPFNVHLLYILGHCMLEGNKLHNSLKTKEVLDSVNLTVPEAIQFGGKKTAGVTEWKSLLYLEPLATSLFQNLFVNWALWSKTSQSKYHPDLYVILITDSRSVLFILQEVTNTVTLVDSHQHSCTKGALIATSEISKMKLLCSWFSDTILHYYNSNPDLYELSFLYYSKKKSNKLNTI